MNDAQRIKLSRFLALLLRHRAHEHGLALDPEGFVPLDELLAAINRAQGWDWVRAADIEEVIARQVRRRYEIVDGDIRAIYGHSLEVEVRYPQVTPPAVLFHGTARRFVEAILREGLRPMGRQYVHLTDDPALAQVIGLRRDDQPAILHIDAAGVQAAGIGFFQADNGVFLARHIPPEFISE
ncbi:MAG TPA: RNA 2'-phosphotransferase [Roseiflexaceae bacterium]|jgi:putative RNA 2'-phosphotransferase|nr:RNA 2'-phosphotransferase [Roseiflexaceae bacterium]